MARPLATASARIANPLLLNMARRIHSTAMRSQIAILTCLLAAPAAASAQIGTGILEKYKAALERQTTDPDQKREGGTQPRDWDYQLPEGVRTRQVTFYVDGGTALYGKLFLPKGFTTTGRMPAVVVGHGINALSIGIEKFAARFAERGLVAMAIDYQSYGFSGSGSDDIRLLERDTTTDASAVTAKIENVYSPAADFASAIGRKPAAVISVPVSIGNAVDSYMKVAAARRS